MTMTALNVNDQSEVPSSSTIVCITPPPSYSESPAATAPPEYVKTAQPSPPAAIPTGYPQLAQTPLQLGSQTMSPSHVASAGAQHVQSRGTNFVSVQGKNSKCKEAMKIIGFICLILLLVIFFLGIVAIYIFFGRLHKEILGTGSIGRTV